MGKMNNGILDDFSGTIGKVVGSNWRGVSYMRAKLKKRTGALSDAQLTAYAFGPIPSVILFMNKLVEAAMTIG